MKDEKMAQWNPYYNNDSNNIPPFPTVGSDNTEQNYYGFSMNLDYNYPMQCENLNNYYYVNGMNPSYNQNNFYVYSTEPIEPQFSYNTVKNPQNDLPVSNQQNKPSIESQHPHQLYNQEFHFDTMKAGCSTVNQSSCDKPVMLGDSYFNSGMSSQNLSLTSGFTVENSTSSRDFNAKHSLRNNSYSNYADNSKHNKFAFDKQKSKHNEFKNNLPESTEGAASNNVPLNYNSKYNYDREKNFPSKHFTNSKKGFHRRDDFDQIKHDDKKKLLRDAAEFLSSQSNNEVVNPPTPSTSNTNDNESVKQPRNYNSDRRTSMPNYYSRNYKYDTQRPNYYTKGNKAQYRNHTDDRRAQEQRNYDIKKKFGNNSAQNYPKKNKGYNDRSNYYEYDKKDYKKSEYRNDSENQRNDFSRKNFNQQRNKKSSKPSTDDFFKEKQVSLKSDDTEKEKLTQREWLTEQVLNGSLECLVCCERIRQNDSIWSCYNCFHIIHLQCVQKWATSSQADKGWRCPACQHVNNEVPMDYYCYCGEMKNPPSNTLNTPHSCGDMCGRMSRRSTCNHKCTLLCHPGPCPQCEALVVRVCGCGATKMSVLCNRSAPLLCENSCNKTLNCGIHKCPLKCHTGDCEPCKEKIKQECYCTKCTREVNCTMETVGVEKFTCNDVCGKDLLCGNHKCKKICHDKECDSCDLLPDLIKTCYCGQTKLTPEQERKSCLDPIPLCEKICSKKLQCGPSSCPHICLSKCHSGLCPPCNGNMLVRCRCGHMDRELACKKLTGQPNDARCEKKCTKKRLCGRHKCNQLCCIEIEHQCLLPCNRMLSCGKHRCEQTCHRGRCLPCYRSSFEELYCECGTSVLYPPVPCGTRRPACTQRCSRQHECNHPVLHNCHSEAECPPCSVLTHKWCYGKHEMRKTIPCHQKEFTCGRPCGKDISCGRHKCIAMCHSGICLPYNVKCTQLCKTPRPSCGHACANVCHDGPCPDTPCKETVKVTCECGHRSTSRGCADNAKEYQRIATAMLASKMADMQLGHSIDIGDIVGNNGQKKQNSLKTLSCNDECRLIERNRRLAIGLQIRNPDLSAKLTPRYSDFMRQWGKKDPRFCQIIHDKLTELVQLAKQSKQKNRSYSFESMNHDKRHFVHEYCEHFGCESAAYDKEPNRNVVATAARDKAWLPSYSLLEVLQREAGQRKVPGPMLRAPNRKPVAESVTLKTSLERPQTRSNTMTLTNSNTSKYEEAEYVDYFDAPSDLP